MRLDLTLEMERPQAVIQKRFQEGVWNGRFVLSREKGNEKGLIPVLGAGKFSLAISIAPCY
jgi:hypothetical protein